MDIKKFNDYIEKNRSAILIGNGFSMNFDKDFGNIFDRIYLAHKDVMRKSEYYVMSNPSFKRKCNDNFKSVKQHLRYISEEELLQIFEDGLIFAESITENNTLVEKLWEKKLITRMTYGLSQLDIVQQICKVGSKKGIESVNIEHWTILIYFYFGIKYLSEKSYYQFPYDNSFINTLEFGNKSRIRLTNHSTFMDTIENTLLNGFTTYYRMLFSTAIFANGKAIDITKLNNINDLHLDNIKLFLNKFNLLMSLNFDHIMDLLTTKRVEHLHGMFVPNKREYVYAQSLSIQYGDDQVSISDIMIGDYFIFKSMLAVINSISQKGNFVNKNMPSFKDQIDNIIDTNCINTVVIFGMNIENDQHVLRNLIMAFYNSDQNNPQIIYCYFNEQEKEDFSNEFDAVLTFSKEVNEYARKIKVSYIKTQEILKEYFYKTSAH